MVARLSRAAAASENAGAWGWLQWPIWDFLGTVATILGLIAIILAVGELRQRRKRVSSTYLEVGSRGSGALEDGTRFHVVSITNGGWAQVNLLTIGVVGGQVLDVPGRDARLRWHLPPGESTEFELTATDYNDVWFLICSISVLDRTRLRWSWEPFTNAGPLMQEQIKQLDKLGRWHRIRQSLRLTKSAQFRAVRAVGPGAESTYVAYVPSGSQRRMDEAHERVVGPFAKTQGTMLSNRLVDDPGVSPEA